MPYRGNSYSRPWPKRMPSTLEDGPARLFPLGHSSVCDRPDIFESSVTNDNHLVQFWDCMEGARMFPLEISVRPLSSVIHVILASSEQPTPFPHRPCFIALSPYTSRTTDTISSQALFHCTVTIYVTNNRHHFLSPYTSVICL